MNKQITLALSAAALVLTASPALADANRAGAALDRIKTSDLDLSSSDDWAVLEKRTENAVKRVCSRDPHGQFLSRSESRKCRDATTAALKQHFAKKTGENNLGG